MHHFLQPFVLTAFRIMLLLPPFFLAPPLSLGPCLVLQWQSWLETLGGFSWPHLHSDRMRPDELREGLDVLKQRGALKHKQP